METRIRDRLSSTGGFGKTKWLLGALAILILLLPGCAKPVSPPVSIDPLPEIEQEPTEPKEPEKEPLDGLYLVSIGNNPDARPQSGLEQAVIVVEVPAEGGITRLMAGFNTKVDKIGPVRSARKPLVHVAVGFNTPFAHCGGSEDSYEILRTNKTKDLDEIYTAGECFWRSEDRTAPDNLYTSTEKLTEGSSRRSFSAANPDFYPSGSLTGRPATHISYEFSKSQKYPNLVEYDFDELSYMRFMNGKEHVDDSGNVICPSALVFLEVQTTYPVGKAIEVDMNLTGQGKALFFSNGVTQEGLWEKPSLKEPLKLSTNKAEDGLKEGLIWIHLVPDLKGVTFE